jgi:hypothetical protein
MQLAVRASMRMKAIALGFASWPRWSPRSAWSGVGGGSTELGRRPVIYVTAETYGAYLRSNLRYPVWIRDVVSEPDLGEGAPWTFWQFHNRGRVAGIERDVDLNVFRGDRGKLDGM